MPRGEVAGVLAIIPGQASLSGECEGIVPLSLCWGQENMPCGEGGSSLDTWKGVCECWQTCVTGTLCANPAPPAVSPGPCSPGHWLAVRAGVRACPEHGCAARACHGKCDVGTQAWPRCGDAAGHLPGYRACWGGGFAGRTLGAVIISTTPFLFINTGVFH